MSIPKSKVVLDSSVFIAAFLSRDGINAEVVRRADNTYELYTADPILTEVRRALTSYSRIRKRYQYSTAEVEEFLTYIRELSEECFSTLPPVSSRLRDPKDFIILACAVKAQADFIVSKDHDLLDLGTYQGITVLSTKAFSDKLPRQRL